MRERKIYAAPRLTAIELFEGEEIVRTSNVTEVEEPWRNDWP